MQDPRYDRGLSEVGQIRRVEPRLIVQHIRLTGDTNQEHNTQSKDWH